MQYLILTFSIIAVFSYGIYLFVSDDKIKEDLSGDYTGYADFYFCYSEDIVIIENQLWIKETICHELHNYISVYLK